LELPVFNNSVAVDPPRGALPIFPLDGLEHCSVALAPAVGRVVRRESH